MQFQAEAHIGTLQLGISQEEMTAAVVAALDKREIENAQRHGLERDTIIKLAQRLTPEEIVDFNQAVRELENAVKVALQVISRAERPSNDNSFVNDVLALLAETTREGRFDEGAAEIDRALAELGRQEKEQRDALRRARETLLEAGLRQDILRRDAFAAAQRIEAIAALAAPNSVATWSEPYRRRLNEFYEEGRDKGVNLSLEIAAEMARRMSVAAQDTQQQGIALNYLGNALATLGERENGTARLEQAVDAYRAALEERTRDRLPLGWAKTQSNLGNTLMALSRREEKLGHINNALEAFRNALTEINPDREPLLWIKTNSNLSCALTKLATISFSLNKHFEGETLLGQAAEVLRNILKLLSREHEPLTWAAAQANLGNALLELGMRTKKETHLRKAVTAFDQALLEQRPDRAPLSWGKSYGARGKALLYIADIKSDVFKAQAAARQIADAEQTLRNGGDIHSADYYAEASKEASAIIQRLAVRNR